ncbi:MAG TPA: HDOD domain-containing protein [Thermoleophilaceae bacterium]|nr:HDOD domain-containing protein [Thermoleophilaceae bacterium]
MSELSVARQPVYDKDLGVYAYELLFQGSADSADLVGTFGSMGLQDLVGNRPAVVRVSESFLYDAPSLQLPADRLILEVDEAPEGPLAALKQLGYTIASANPELALADIAKLNVAELGQHGLWQQIELVRGKRLLATNVQTHEELEFCKGLGFDYYEGGFLCQPRTVLKRTVPTNRMAKLGILAELNNPEADFDGLERLISRDVGLSYRFLRYINSAFFSLPHKVGSIRQALVLLGISAVKKWATLLSLADLDDKPHELIVTALVRAKMCELTAGSRPPREREEYFTVGMFSVVDALLDSPMDVVLASLPLADEIKEALQHQLGQKGLVLKAVVNYENARFEDLRAIAPPGTSAQEIYAASIAWAREAGLELEAGDAVGVAATP